MAKIGTEKKGIHTSFHFAAKAHSMLKEISKWARRSMAGELDYLIRKEHAIRKEQHEQGKG